MGRQQSGVRYRCTDSGSPGRTRLRYGIKCLQRKQTRLFLGIKHFSGHLGFVIEAMHLFTYSVHPRKDKLADNGEHLSLRQGRLGQEVRNQVAVFAVYGGVLTEFLQGLARIFHSYSEKQRNKSSTFRSKGDKSLCGFVNKFKTRPSAWLLPGVGSVI